MPSYSYSASPNTATRCSPDLLDDQIIPVQTHCIHRPATIVRPHYQKSGERQLSWICVRVHDFPEFRFAAVARDAFVANQTFVRVVFDLFAVRAPRLFLVCHLSGEQVTVTNQNRDDGDDHQQFDERKIRVSVSSSMSLVTPKKAQLRACAKNSTSV